MKYMGVDLGKKGGLAILEEGKEIIYLGKMPVIKSSKTTPEYDVLKIIHIIKTYKPDFAMIEKPMLLPVSGKKSYYNSGYGLGIFRGVFATLGIRQDIVSPRTWQKRILGSFDKGDSKQASIMYANMQFPNLQIKNDDNLSDALCIALYSHRKYVGLEHTIKNLGKITEEVRNNFHKMISQKQKSEITPIDTK